MWLVQGTYFILGFFWLVLSWKGDKNEGIHQLLIKFWLFGLIVTGVLVWLPGLVAGDSGLASCKPDVTGCLPGLFTVDHGLVVAAEGGPEYCCMACPQSVRIFSLSFHLWRVNQNQAPYCFPSHSYSTRAHPSFWSRIKPPWTSSWNRSHKNFQKPIRNRKLAVLKQWRVGVLWMREVERWPGDSCLQIGWGKVTWETWGDERMSKESIYMQQPSKA